MFVIDRSLRISQCRPMITHDEILAELVRQLDAGQIRPKNVAEHLGIARPRVSEMRKQERRIQPNEMPKLARLLGMKWGDDVPVVGYVGAGGHVIFEDAFEKGGSLYRVEVLPGIHTMGLIGLEIRGDSMYPLFRDGYVAFIRRDGWDHVEDEALRDWAVCRLVDGSTLLKEVRRSAEQGRFDLISTNAPPLEGVELIWATPVQGWRRR